MVSNKQHNLYFIEIQSGNKIEPSCTVKTEYKKHYWSKVCKNTISVFYSQTSGNETN